MVGRPRKYDEKLQIISIALEPTFISALEEEANAKGKSRNEYITALLISADKTLAKYLINKFDNLKNQIKTYSGMIQEFSDKMAKYQTKSLDSFLFDDLPNIPEIYFLFEKFADRIDSAIRQKDIPEAYKIDNMSKWLFSEFQNIMLQKNKVVKRPSDVKACIKSRLLKEASIKSRLLKLQNSGKQ